MSLYGAVAAARRRLYDRGILASESVTAPVVSVGNIVWGGTGKTPVVAALAAHWEGAGRRTGIVSRGYRRRSRGTVVVSDGAGRLAGVEEAGDEPRLLARRFPHAVVVVSERRAAAARESIRLGAEIVILDDGFQHLALRRDADVVLLDADDPFGGGPPPAGRAREDAAALARADLVLVTRAGSADSAADRETPRWTAAPVRHVRFRFAGWFRDGAAAEPPAGAGIAVCAIGNPASFRTTLADSGAPAAELLVFRDHHAYGAADVRRIERAAERSGATHVLTTEKDEEKLAGKTRLPLRAARIEADFLEDDVFTLLDALVSERRA